MFDDEQGNFKQVPYRGLTVGEFRKRFSQASGVDINIVAVVRAVGDCLYPLPDDEPMPPDPNVVFLQPKG